MQKWRRLVFSKTRNRLILVTAVVLMVAILGVTVALYSAATDALTAQFRETVWERTQHLQRTLNVELAEYEKLLLSFRLDRSLHDQIKKTDYENYTDFTKHMSELSTQLRSDISACAYLPELTMYLAVEYPYTLPPNGQIRPLEQAEDEPWMVQALQSGRAQLCWSTYTASDGVSRRMLRATIPVVDRDNGTLLAVACLRQQMRYITGAISQTMDMENGDVYILDGDGTLIYGICDKAETDVIPSDLAGVLGELPDGIVDLENHTLFITEDPIRNWKILYVTDADLFIERNLLFGQRTIIALALTILLSLVLVFVTSDVVTRRLRLLTAAVKNVEEEALTVDFSDDGKDEVSDLYQAFSKLLQRVRNLIDRNRRIEQEKYALELQTLQEQIAPHFLYNTLSSIHAMAQDIEADDISAAVLSLAEFYRLALSNGASIVSIRTERELLEYYVQICRIRFGDKVTITLDFDEEISDYATPKLVLQPFVENAIMHGLREKGLQRCHVQIRAFASDECICMQVEDDGVGIPEDRLAEILRQPYDPNKHHAIQNIHRRIQLFYGEQYGVHISSRPQKGTCVRITVPKIPMKS